MTEQAEATARRSSRSKPEEGKYEPDHRRLSLSKPRSRGRPSSASTAFAEQLEEPGTRFAQAFTPG